MGGAKEMSDSAEPELCTQVAESHIVITLSSLQLLRSKQGAAGAWLEARGSALSSARGVPLAQSSGEGSKLSPERCSQPQS